MRCARVDEMQSYFRSAIRERSYENPTGTWLKP